MFAPEGLSNAFASLIKIGIAVLLGGAIGWEREIHGRPAGIRTHMLMVLGVVVFSEVSRAFAPGDPNRIAAQIVTGIGFLGAGTILRMGPEIKGLTTAASIWAGAAIGMCVSAGGPYILVAVFCTILALLTLTVVDKLELRLHPRMQSREIVVNLQSEDVVGAVVRALNNAEVSVQSIRFAEEEAGAIAVIRVKGDPERCFAAVTSVDGVKGARWSTK
jgi:putative Mg2+ transporter-C (MgtC) family protein